MKENEETTHIIDVCKKALLFCKYKRSLTEWAGGQHTIVVGIGDTPTIFSHTETVWSDGRRGTNSYIEVTVSPRWYTQVYQRGLAVVRGIFVLDVINEDEKGITVLAGHRGRGYSIRPAYARIVKTLGGGYRLYWKE